jgi:hypothetical protein
MRSYVGIDLHRRWSVVVVLNEDGDRLSWSRIDNTPANLAAEIVAAGGVEAEVAMEATWGVVLGGPRDRRMRRPVASGPSVGDRRLAEPPDEERHP